MKNQCEAKPAFNPAAGPRWSGWGADLMNSRMQTAARACGVMRAALRAAEPRLKGLDARRPVVVHRQRQHLDSGAVLAQRKPRPTP